MISSFVNVTVGDYPNQWHGTLSFLVSILFLLSTVAHSLAIVPGRMSSMKGCVYIATSVDGFIADTDGSLDWLNTPTNESQVEGEDYGFSEFLKSVDVIIMGRTTFEVVIGFGPEAWAYGEIPMVVWTRHTAESVEERFPKWVPKTVRVHSSAVSASAGSGKGDAGIADAEECTRDLWNQLEAEGYQRAYIDGGQTIRSFLNAGMIHHLCITRIPILLGNGIPLFGSGGGREGGRGIFVNADDDVDSDNRGGSTETTTTRTTRTTTAARKYKLHHVSTQSYPNGYVITKYDVDHSPNGEATRDSSSENRGT